MTRYAEGTSVATIHSRMQIEQLLQRRGAQRTAMAAEPGRAVVYFELADRRIQISMPLPSEQEVLARSGRKKLPPDTLRNRLAQAEREKWRALLLSIKSKFVAIDAGVETLEEAFLAHVVMPGGRTMKDLALPEVAEAYKTGKVRHGFLLGAGEAPP